MRALRINFPDKVREAALDRAQARCDPGHAATLTAAIAAALPPTSTPSATAPEASA